MVCVNVDEFIYRKERQIRVDNGIQWIPKLITIIEFFYSISG